MNLSIRYRWAWFFATIVALAGCTYVTAISALTSQALVFVLALSASSLIISACNTDVFKRLIEDSTTDIVETPDAEVVPVDQEAEAAQLLEIGEIGTIYGSTTQVGFLQNFAPGDINGDGIGDVVVLDYDRNGIFVVFGPVEGDVDVDDLGDSGFVIEGEYGGQFTGTPAFGDVNGDGKVDIVSSYYYKIYDYYFYGYYQYGATIVAFGKDNTDPVTVDNYDQSVSDGFFIDASVAKYDNYFVGPQIADFNGDGLDDIVLLAGDGDSKYSDRIAVIWGKDDSDPVYSHEIYYGDQGFYVFNEWNYGFATQSLYSSVAANGVSVLDFNNDGKDDLVLTDKYQEQIFVIFGGDRDESGFINDYEGYHAFYYGEANVVPGIAIRQKYSESNYSLLFSPDIGVGDFNGDGFNDFALLGGLKYFDQDHFEYRYGEDLEGGDYGWRYLEWEYGGIKSQYLFVVWGTDQPQNLDLNLHYDYDYDYDYYYEETLFNVASHAGDYGYFYFEGSKYSFDHLKGKASVIQGDFLASVGNYAATFGYLEIDGGYGFETFDANGDRNVVRHIFEAMYGDYSYYGSYYGEIEHRDNRNTIEVGDFDGDGVDDLIVQGRPELNINFDNFTERNWKTRSYVIHGSHGMDNDVESQLVHVRDGSVRTPMDTNGTYFKDEDNYLHSYSYYSYSGYMVNVQRYNASYEGGYLELDSLVLQGVNDIDGDGKVDLFVTDGYRYGHLIFGGSLGGNIDTSELSRVSGHSFNTEYMLGINAGHIDGDRFKEILISQHDYESSGRVIRIFGVLPPE